jgi:hypothetical protein
MRHETPAPVLPWRKKIPPSVLGVPMYDFSRVAVVVTIVIASVIAFMISWNMSLMKWLW